VTVWIKFIPFARAVLSGFWEKEDRGIITNKAKNNKAIFFI
jgi:hypothetical protein